MEKGTIITSKWRDYCLSIFLLSDHITEEHARHKCHVCDLPGTKMCTKFQSLSSFLNILLKRFSFDDIKQLQYKLYTQVSLQEYLYLDIPVDALSGEQKNVKNIAQCELMGIIMHSGATAQSGHYVAYVKKDNIWELHNDSSVTQIPVFEVFSKQVFRNAYLLTYRIINN